MSTTAAPRAERAPRAVRSLRAGVFRAGAAPVAGAAYALGTFGDEHRPAMLALSAALLGFLGLLWLGAHRIVTSRFAFAIQGSATVAVVLGVAGLLLLEGGVSSPLGALVVYALLFFGATVPPRLFAVVAVVGGVSYAVVAVVGDPAPQGYAPTMMIGAVGVGFLCRRYASSLAAIRRRLAELSTIDPLTGCLNRRGFDDLVAQELAQAQRTGDKVTLVLIDLDRFKDVNDSYGHGAGDDVLAWTAATLRRTVRAHDAVGRIGGDEFAVLLVNTAADAASTAVERLRAGVGELAPASYGFAVFPDDGSTAAELRHHADERLYADKADHAGTAVVPSKDRIDAVHVADDDPGLGERTTRRIDRLHRTVLDLGLLCTFCHLTGLLYILVLAGDRPNRVPIAIALFIGASCGLLEVLGAEQIARSRWAGAILTGLAVPEFASAAVAVILDGGVLSPMSFGLVAPLPMVAYGSPPRKAAPIVTGVLVGYAVIGVVVGGVSAWYIGLYIVGSLALVLACARLGREAAVKRRRLHELSRADVMTGCLNRRGFEERFHAEASHTHRAGRSMALLLIDLDGFKQVNDTYGHAAGDELLVWVAATVSGTVHPHDAVGRLGGDEFAVLLTGDGESSHHELVQRLQAELGARTRASAGIAQLGLDGGDFDALYAVADERLYEAKRRGRDGTPAPAPVVEPA